MKKISFLAVFALFLFTFNACDDGWGIFDSKRVEGKGPTTKEERSVADFKSIDLSAAADVYVSVGSATKVTVEAQKNIADIFETVVENGVLKLRFKSGSWNVNFQSLKIYVETPSLEGFDLSGSGNVKISSGFAGEKFVANIGGSGNLDADDVKAKNLEASITGSGNLTISGEGDNANLEVSGSGELKATGFKTKTTKAEITGSGNIDCHASEAIDAHITGSGDIRYTGNPTKETTKVTGSGDISRQ